MSSDLYPGYTKSEMDEAIRRQEIEQRKRHIDNFLYNLWHDASELPVRETWILMADAHGHYMAGKWMNDGKGFESIGEIHVGPFKFHLPIGLEGDIVKWCYIDKLNKDIKGGFID